MNLNLHASGPIAPGGAVLQVAGDDDLIWLASPAGLFHFDGTNWRAMMRGIPFWRINTILTAGQSIWVAGMPGGIVRSTNRGQAWHRCWTDQAETPIITLAASPNYGHDRVLLAGTDGDGILRTTDGGRHWELSNFGLRDFSIFDLVTAPVWERYEYAFAISEGGLYQSPNGGRAWRRADLGQMNVQPLAVAVSPDFETTQTVIAGCEAGELLVSTDAVKMVPVFIALKTLDWLDTYRFWGVTALFGHPYFIFMLRQFFRSIPEELSEAARIDGANELTILFRIILPLSKPALAVVALFRFLWAWNDYLGPKLFIRSQENFPLALGIELLNQRANDVGACVRCLPYLMAVSTIVTLPIVIAFFFAQRTFIEGINLTGTKG